MRGPSADAPSPLPSDHHHPPLGSHGTMSAGRPLSPSPSTSSGLSDFDRLWESSLSQPVSRARPAQSSSSAPAPTAPALDLRRQTKRRRLLSPARSDTTAGSERSEAKEKSGAGGGSGEGDEEGSARDGEKGDDELDGLDFSDSLSLTSYTPPLAAGLALLDGLALADDGVLDDGPAGGSTDDGPLDSSGTDGEDGVSEADGWDFSLPSAAAAQEPDGLPLGESQSASLEPTTRAERQCASPRPARLRLLDPSRARLTRIHPSARPPPQSPRDGPRRGPSARRTSPALGPRPPAAGQGRLRLGHRRRRRRQAWPAVHQEAHVDVRRA